MSHHNLGDNPTYTSDAMKYAMETLGAIRPVPPHHHPHRHDFAFDLGVGSITKREDFKRKIMDRHMSILAYRLRLDEGVMHPFEFINLHITDEKAFVFIVKKGEAVILEDDPSMFPSDKLVASLRLLIG